MAQVRSTNPGAPKASSGRSSSANQNTSNSGSSNSGSSFNVVDNYDWAINKGVDIPYAKLTEFEFDGSPVTNGYAHFARFTLGVLNTVTKFSDGCIADALGIGDIESSGEHMNPYAGLYKLKPTGNTYKLPYFENNVNGRTNSWAPSYGGDDGNILADFGAGFADAINKYSPGFGFGVLSEPGIYVERVKFYQPSDASADALQITFPLLNTQSEDSISKNQELIKTLAKNTSPSRKSKTVLEPPKLYEVKIPGIRFIKYGYISPFAVNLVGTRRMIENKIVPEAYMLSISVNSLTDESGNFLIEAQK